MKVSHPYDNLKFAINDSSHKENKVYAEQINCPKELRQIEFVSFGSFRSGHRLQMRNLLYSLITKNISFNNMSVSSLICQSLWEIGIIDFESNNFNIPSSHYDFKNTEFLNQLYLVLDDFLNGIEKKWNDNLILYNIITIILRAISLIENDDTYEKVLKKMINLLRKCRHISNQWEEILKEVILKENNIEKQKLLKIELIKICLYSIITFNVTGRAQVLVMSISDDIVSWLISSETISRTKNMSGNIIDHFLENLFRKAETTTLNISNRYLEIINAESCRRFILKTWPDAKLGSIDCWKFDNENNYPYWCSGLFKRTDNPSNQSILHISITGEFLINYYPMGKLPKSILEHNEFRSFFEYSDFDVQPASEGIGSFVISIKIKENQNLSYTFFESNENLIIIERINENESYLIPKKILKNHLPSIFLNDYSHWYNKNNKKIEFRLKTFSPKYIDELIKLQLSIRYTLNLNDLTLTDNIDKRYLIYYKSCTFNEIFKKFAHRLDDSNHVHLFKDIVDKDLIYIDFPRLNLRFKLDKFKNVIWSVEHSNFKVSNCQKLETLIGLKSMIVLIENEDYPNKKIIIPHGELERSIENDNKKILIKYDENRKPSYFSYIIDENLQSIKAEDSNTAWLYLALLHAYTSNILNDPFTKMTGTEMSLYLLKSGNCWSCKELSEESLLILNEIKYLSPQRNYYPKGMKIMQNVKFPDNISSICASEEFHLIVQQIIEDSERLNFAFQLDNSKKRKTEYTDLVLSKKAYLRNSKFFYNDKSIDYVCTKQKAINVTYKPEIRKIATQSYSPSYFDLVSFIFESDCNFSLENENFVENNRISKWFEFSDDCLNYLKEYWYDLFDFSRKNINSVKLSMILSYFAYKNIDLNYILLFQRVVLNSYKFLSISDPPLINYKLSDSYTYKDEKIKEILEAGYSENQKYYNEIKRQDIFIILNQYSRHNNNLIFQDYISPHKHKFLEDPTVKIKLLFSSWLNNKKLSEFLIKVQRTLQSLTIPQEIQLLEVKENLKYVKKNTISVKINMKKIKENSFKINKDFQKKLSDSIEIVESRSKKAKYSFKDFPDFINDSNCKLSENYFKILNESWSFYHKNQTDNEIKFDIDKIIDKNQEKEKYFKNELSNFIKYLNICYEPNDSNDECLKLTNIWPKKNPLVFFRYLVFGLPDDSRVHFDQKILAIIETIGVFISLRNQAIRCIKYAKNSDIMRNHLKKELVNTPFKNWSPSEKPEWLLIQLELDIIIKESQVN